MGNKFTKISIAEKAIDKFKNTPISKRSLAKYLSNKYPLQFPNTEQARTAIRYVTGTTGERHRMNNKNIKTMYSISDIPESHSEPWLPYVIDHKKFNRILLLSDIHFPYHDKIALDAAIKYGIKKKCNLVVLNGDTLDMYQMSNFNKDPSKADMSIEFKMAKDFIKTLRKSFKNILFKTGNHCERWQVFLTKNPAIFGMDEFKLDKILGLEKHEYVTDKRIIKAGELSILHGHEVGKGIFSPVNFARTLQLKTGTNTIAGHVHQISQHPFTRLNGTKIMCYSTGCLCELRPQYMPINQWQHGFAYIELETNGIFHLENKQIENGKIY